MSAPSTCQRVDGPGALKARLPPFEYVAPQSLEEACGFLAEHGERARPLAGGTDLLIKLGRRLLDLEWVVALKQVPGLDRISFDPATGLCIGATAPLASVAAHPEIRAHYSAVAHAANHTATVQIRNMATIGGNLGNASPCADNAPTLMVLGATLTIAGPNTERSLKVAELFRGPSQTVLRFGEILKSIAVPPPAPGTGAAYLRHSARSRVDLSAVSVAAWLRIEGDTCAAARIALGAVAPTPHLATEAADLLAGEKLSAGLLEAVGKKAAEKAKPIDDVRGTAAYRREMVQVLTKRALIKARERAEANRG